MHDMADREDVTRLLKLGKYRLEGILGRGAMGIVYKGYDTVIERFVALKVLRAELLGGEDDIEWLARFKREVQAAGRCIHPNIVTLFEYGEDQNIPYIVMEYVQGQELKTYLRNQGHCDEKLALSIIIQVLNALAYAHERGIVHRDIKPGNIILLKDNHVKVADFGVARIDTSTMTQLGLALGTPGYMAPEQFTGGPITPATDLYATGAVLFELLTGEKPFSGKTVTEIMYQVLQNNLRDVMELNRQVSASLQVVIRRALARNPGERFQTAREFAAALAQAVPDAVARDNTTGADQPTVLLTPANVPAAPQTDSRPFWEPGILREAEEQLTLYVGPVAKIMVKKAAQQATDIEDLYQILAQKIATGPEKTLFLQRGKRLQANSEQIKVAAATSPQQENLFSPQSLEAITRELAVYLGPIAKILVRKAAGQALSLEDLYRRLAMQIPSERERIAFLKKVHVRA
jgi:serine/threonine-protein kinase